MNRPQPARDERAHPSVTRRGFVLIGLQLGVAGGLAWRLRDLQVVEADRFRLLAEENRINVELLATPRAEIRDRLGKPLAINTRNYRVLMIREQAGDPEAMLDRLSRLIEISDRQRARVLKDIRQKPVFVPVGVAEHLDWKAFAAINANAPALPGIQPEVGLTRSYPQGAELAHVVGYVGRVSDWDLQKIRKSGRTVDPILQHPEFQIGKTGIERSRELGLRGRAGTRQVEVNAKGRIIRELSRTEGKAGEDLHLTIDLDLQRHANERLGEESAAAVLIDIQNGDVVAAASTPTFDPNPFILGISHKDFNALRDNDHRPLHNKWASGLYPPGSTFKMVVALAALETGIVKPTKTFYCPGYLELGRRRFHCWRRGGHGWVDLRKSIEQSCDVYYYELARQIGIRKIGEMARKLGFGSDFDVPIAAVREGLVPTKAWKLSRHKKDWLVGDTLNAGIGQGYMLATPLQMAVMTARIASGKAVAPRLIRAQGGRPLAVTPPPDLGLNREYLTRIRRGMYDAVNSRRGTAVGVKIVDRAFRMAGKTGTAQVRNITKAERARGVIRNRDLPWARRDHALFVAFAPYDKPRFAVAVVVEHGGSGSKAAAPIARDILMKAREIMAPSGQAPEHGSGPKRGGRA